MNAIRTILAAGCLAGVSGCAVIPGASYVPEPERRPSLGRAYFDAKTPDLTGSRVLGVPKANPAWWITNSDSPLPWWWRPGEPLAVRERTWLMRNPFHNFTNYVIGVADRPTVRYGLNANSIWNERGPVNLAVTNAGPLLWLPMISWRGWLTEGYFGWRERGNFGASLRRAQHDSDGTGRRGASPLSRARELYPELDPEAPGGVPVNVDPVPVQRATPAVPAP